MSNDGWLPLTIHAGTVDASKHFVRVREGKVEHRTEEEHVRMMREEWNSIAARTDHVDAVKRIYDTRPRADWPLGLRVLSEAPHVRARWANPDVFPDSVTLIDSGLGDLGSDVDEAFPSFMTYARASVYHLQRYPADAMRQLDIMVAPNVRDSIPPEAAICAIAIGENRLLVFMRARCAIPTGHATATARVTAVHNARRDLAIRMNEIKLPVIDGVKAISRGWFESNFVDGPPVVHMYMSIGEYAVTAYDDACSSLSVNISDTEVPFATFAKQPVAGAQFTRLLKRPHHVARA